MSDPAPDRISRKPAQGTVGVYYHTFGCKANQYDTERMRQELEARGARTVEDREAADVCVVNTCTVTNQADAQAQIGRAHV